MCFYDEWNYNFISQRTLSLDNRDRNPTCSVTAACTEDCESCQTQSADQRCSATPRQVRVVAILIYSYHTSTRSRVPSSQQQQQHNYFTQQQQ